MINLIFNALVFGLILALLIGPVFFTLIETSLEKGLNKAIIVAIGISLSDIAYIIVSYFGVSSLLVRGELQNYIGYAGGGILIGFGIFSVLKFKRKVPKIDSEIRSKGFFRYLVKGFVINGLSPFVLLFWVAAVSLVTSEYNFSVSYSFYFFAIVMITVFLTDVLKAYLAGKLRTLITTRALRIMNIITGIALILFGGRMILINI